MWWLLDIAFILVGLLHIYLAPYSKVEESFNAQALHDLLFHRQRLELYDHFEFPGVVPRTFIGPLIIALLSSPFSFILSILKYSKFQQFLLCRTVLLLMNYFAFKFYQKSVKLVFADKPIVAKFLLIVHFTQFHFMFYLSRPLANIFALFFVFLSYGFWLRGKHAQYIWTSAFVILVFRSELAILLGLLLLVDLIDQKVSISSVLLHGLSALVCTVAVTVAIDSIFWKKLIWPEAVVFYYNVVLNKSSAWGTLPIHSYVTNLLPKALGPLVPLLLLYGLYLDARVKRFVIPITAYVCLYSLLPHKELRFVLYVVPVFNLGAALGWHHFVTDFKDTKFHKLFWAAIIGLIGANVAFTGLTLAASMHNYPGGVALHKFHRYVSPKAEVNLHMDNLVCQTGAIRFGQLNNQWAYNKTENLKPGSYQLMDFSHLLVDMSTDYQVYRSTHTVLFTVKGYSKMNITKTFPFFHLIMEPKIIALQSKNYDSVNGKILPTSTRSS